MLNGFLTYMYSLSQMIERNTNKGILRNAGNDLSEVHLGLSCTVPNCLGPLTNQTFCITQTSIANLNMDSKAGRGYIRLLDDGSPARAEVKICIISGLALKPINRRVSSNKSPERSRKPRQTPPPQWGVQPERYMSLNRK